MRTIKHSSQFKRDYKRIKATPRYGKQLDLMIATVLEFLAVDKLLPDNYRDHKLSGDWQGCRECHLKPDLLLIYRNSDQRLLELV